VDFVDRGAGLSTKSTFFSDDFHIFTNFFDKSTKTAI
jgi:hypothetical protein